MTHHTTTLDGRALVVLAEAARQRWLLFAWGRVEHPAGDFDVTPAFAEQMLASFRAMTADGYYPPILEEHEPNGGALGLVRGLSTDDDGIWADVELASGVEEEIASGRRPYLSPSFYPTFAHPHTGDELEMVLREVSLVSVPHLKNLRPLGSHYSLSESGWATTTQEAVMADQPETPETAPVPNEETPEMDMAEAVAELMEGYKKLSERMDKIESSMMPEEPEEAAEATENGESVALKRVAELERKLAVADAKTTVLAVLPTALAEEVDDLAHAIVTDKARGTRLLSLAERAYKAETKPTTNTVQEPIGVPGSAQGPVSLSEAWDICAAELGTADAGSIGRMMEKRFPHLTGHTLIG